MKHARLRVPPPTPAAPAPPLPAIDADFTDFYHTHLPTFLPTHLFPFLTPTDLLSLTHTHPTFLANPPPPPALKLHLYPHQQTSLSFLTARESLPPPTTPFPSSCAGGILADEPGLGKTVTVLALIANDLPNKGFEARVKEEKEEEGEESR